ncbi:MAG: hypothetical protein US50_C0004G0029 [Candidatus Nomurabacteria bacterium GW2011_GWB1_37_5]|uniref:Uncharacterized protein n=1 Tax=Candidatus Nomurabacteria bacterium GW2011_GWB1_37_5 TaxID=1618742 RepID=A0A0G0HBD5_9BACT|nr:MAG: hypothetical protein US50_C0004G0029 [Candidatus Nomurabacteria bacterium GW2011_GWB1_37_5]
MEKSQITKGMLLRFVGTSGPEPWGDDWDTLGVVTRVTKRFIILKTFDDNKSYNILFDDPEWFSGLSFPDKKLLSEWKEYFERSFRSSIREQNEFPKKIEKDISENNKLLKLFKP